MSIKTRTDNFFYAKSCCWADSGARSRQKRLTTALRVNCTRCGLVSRQKATGGEYQRGWFVDFNKIIRKDDFLSWLAGKFWANEMTAAERENNSHKAVWEVQVPPTLLTKQSGNSCEEHWSIKAWADEHIDSRWVRRSGASNESPAPTTNHMLGREKSACNQHQEVSARPVTCDLFGDFWRCLQNCSFKYWSGLWIDWDQWQACNHIIS